MNAARINKLSLLVVEDDEICQEFIKSTLAGTYDLTRVHNGKEALSALSGQKTDDREQRHTARQESRTYQ